MSTDANESAGDGVEAAVLAALRQHADVEDASCPTSEADDEALISAAVEAYLDGAKVTRLAPRRARRAPWIAAGGLLAAAAALALWFVPRDSSELADATATATAAATDAQTSAPAQARWRLEPEGTPAEGVVGAGQVERCGERRGARACLAPGSRARFEGDGDLELLDGRAQVEAEASMTLQLAGARVQTSVAGSVFVAELHAERWSVSVDEGSVTLTGADGEARALAAGESASSETPVADPAADPAVDAAAVEDSGAGSERAPKQAKPSPGQAAAPTPSADELLARARSQRAAKDFEAAAASYEALVRAYPSAPKARAALVSLAQLYLGPLDDPGRALRHFDRYLERGGALAEEARHGKIRALRALGRDAKAEAEAEAFLRDYPNSAYADALRGG
ncbi:tetratricopeptide repeat protein [Pseudenhygromyxa sp. WMMC2535]|uniref:tetratricopeptide repeat protein n=1 Tax=Pseudenhygromyxa sp. WMMC2535 TaxID=2712867 RepID=UPI0015539BFF|nr:tetratricopeptide repeat protein [Pseudenhygromyxa sp. WMMC2535]NVB39660.1 tetratricopeptide repeat protein [Pseudenhygromyxa sp. WMMC2535]